MKSQTPRRISSLKPTPLLILIASFFTANRALATVFNVGPDQPLATPSDVAWESLEAGDTVRIHWKADPYRDKWVICRQGTEAQPITVIGVPGPNGERPVIDGNNATTRLALDYWNEARGVIKIGGASTPSDSLPSHIVIDGLEIRGGRSPYGFTDDRGNSQNYSDNAAALYLEKGEQLTVRNCVLRDCGNGLFVAASCSNVMVEGNSLYDNGDVGSIYEHNSYTEAAGITFQYNHYGPLRAGCLGNNLKDRSAGTVIRYNWIEGGNRQLDLVDSSNLNDDPSYTSTFVYGNVFIEPDDSGNRQIIHYGGDSGNEESYRKGTLYLYNNTIISTRAERTTLLRLSTNDEAADCRNNIIFVTATGNQLELLSNAGNLTLNNNWIKPGAVNSFQSGYIGTVNGAATNILGSDPGFINATLQNFHLTSDSDSVDSATALHSATSTDHTPVREYRKHQQSEVRRQLSVTDLGAFEYSAYAVWRDAEFGTDAEDELVSGENADPDGDQISNFLEFAFMRDPLIASAGALTQPAWVTIGEGRYFSLEFQRRLLPSGLVYRTMVSENLKDWLPGNVYTDTETPLSTDQTTDASAAGVTRVRLNAAAITEPRAFMKIEVGYE